MMDKFWQLIIDVRDFSYHWTVKQHDEKWAATEYKHKVNGFISGYVALLIFFIIQFLCYFFGMESQDLPITKNDPWWKTLPAGAAIYLLPWFLISHYLLKKNSAYTYSYLLQSKQIPQGPTNVLGRFSFGLVSSCRSRHVPFIISPRRGTPYP